VEVRRSKFKFSGLQSSRFRKSEGKEIGTQQGEENPKSEVTKKDFDILGLRRPEGGEDIGFKFDVSNSQYMKLN